MTGVYWAMLRMETCREHAHGGVSETNESAKFTGQQHRGLPGGVTEICEGRNVPYGTQKEHRFADALIVDLQSPEMGDGGPAICRPPACDAYNSSPRKPALAGIPSIAMMTHHHCSDKDNTR